MFSHKKLNSPSTALATTMSYRRNSSNLPAVYSKAALQCLIAAFPNARYWKKEMGELHTMPDCCSLEHKVSYMYVDESATPKEFRGPCGMERVINLHQVAGWLLFHGGPNRRLCTGHPWDRVHTDGPNGVQRCPHRLVLRRRTEL